MDKRAIGDLGLTSASLGLGCMAMTGSYGAADERESIATLRRAVELGVGYFDTADVYGPFTGERLVGRTLAAVRDQVVLATKFGGAEMTDDGTVVGGPSGRPDYVRHCVDRSLSNLGTDYIDLLFQHRVDPDVPVEETFGALGELVDAGKVRYLGISEAASATIRRAHAIAPLSAVQTEYSLFSRQVEENGVLDTVRELGIGFIAYAPLGRGFLTGTIRSADQVGETDLRALFPRFKPEHLDQNLRLLVRLEAAATALGMSVGQLALSWLMSKAQDIIAIPGTRRSAHLEENVHAAETQLDAETVREIEAIVPVDAVAGSRRAPAEAAWLQE